MKKEIKLSCIITLILGIISINWLIYDIYEINKNLIKVLHFDESGYIIGIGYLFILLFHFSAFILIIIHFQLLEELKLLKIVSLIFGIISLFAIGVEKVLFDEIAREYRFEWEIPGEVFLLYFALVINIIFTILVFVLIFKTLKISPIKGIKKEVKDEKIFTLAQYMGIISGVMGIYLTISLVHKQVPANRLWIYIPFYILFLVPYALTVLYWLSIKLKEKIIDWYDEKQLKDIMKSALTTLILSIPGLSILLFIKQPINFYWFPYYIFLILLIFSGSTLYFFKRC